MSKTISGRVVALTSLLAACILACGGKSASDGPACCPPDPAPSGCLHLGGANRYGCPKTCDFYCSINWRMETDDAGCPVWAWDVRKPAPGETAACFPDRDAHADAPRTEPRV